jgi:hypothetical protein
MKHNASQELVAQSLREVTQSAEVFRAHSRRGLYLNAHYLALPVLEDGRPLCTATTR